MDKELIYRLLALYDYLKKINKVSSQKDFCEKIGIGTSMFTEVKKGRSGITRDNLQSITEELLGYKDWLFTGKGEMLIEGNPNIDRENHIYVPLLPISAQGGTLNDFVVYVKAEECEQIISPIKDIDFAMSVNGDSMAPDYPSGSQILIKKINERAFIEWGKVYVLDTCNGSVIKKIMPSETEDKIRCISINTEYPSFDVSKDDIYGVYRVVMCMSMK